MLHGFPCDDDAVHADPAGDVESLGPGHGRAMAAGRGGLGARGTPALRRLVRRRRGRRDAGLREARGSFKGVTMKGCQRMFLVNVELVFLDSISLSFM